MWTDARISELKLLCVDERKLSAAEIGVILQISRNSVIGKAKRMGLKLPCPPYISLRRKVPKRRPAAMPTIRVRRQRRAPVEYANWAEKAVAPVTFAKLAARHCRWPVSENNAPILFCGADKASDSSYCLHHYNVAHTPHFRRSYAEAAE